MLQLGRLEHHDRNTKIAARVDGDIGGKFFRQFKLLLGSDLLQDADNFGVGGRWDSHLQASRLDRRNDLGERLAMSHDAAVGHVSLHCSSEGGLRGLGEFVHLVDDDDLEGFLSLRVELLGAGNLFDQLLNDDLVVVVRVGGSDLDVVVAAVDDALDGGGARGARLELFQLALDLGDVW